MSSKYKKLSVRGRKIDEHRYLWEQVHGPIPGGYVVHHKNGDKADNRLENLELLTLPEHSKRHNPRGPWGNFSPEAFLRWDAANRESIAGRTKNKLNSDVAWCGRCKTYKPKEEFGKNRLRVNGLSDTCRACRSESRKK